MATHVLPAAEVDQHQAAAGCPCEPVETDARTWTHTTLHEHCAGCGCRIVWSDRLRMWLHDITDGQPCDNATP